MTFSPNSKLITLMSGYFVVCVFGAANKLNAGPAIELIPIVVYQGQNISRSDFESLTTLRQNLKDFPFVHAVNPTYGMEGSQRLTLFKSSFSGLVKPDDGIIMHVAPIASWTNAAKMSEPTSDSVGIYGRANVNCSILCGIDRTLESLNSKEISQFLEVGRNKLSEMGLGSVKSALFEQGLVNDELWDLAKDAGLKYDFSGFNVELTKSYLGRMPVYQSILKLSNSLLSDGGSKEIYKGRYLDFVRNGIYVDVANEEVYSAHLANVIKFAIAENRKVQMPIFLNLMSIVHNESKVTAIVNDIKKQANETKVSLVVWNGDGNSGWSYKDLKDEVAHETQIQLLSKEKSLDEAKQVASSSKSGSEASPSESNEIEAGFVPAEQDVLPSHSKEMSH